MEKRVLDYRPPEPPNYDWVINVVWYTFIVLVLAIFVSGMVLACIALIGTLQYPP